MAHNTQASPQPVARQDSSVKSRLAAFQGPNRLGLSNLNNTYPKIQREILTDSPRQASLQKINRAVAEAAPIDSRLEVTNTPRPKKAPQFIPGIVSASSTYSAELTLSPGQGCYFAKLIGSDGQKKQFNILSAMWVSFSVKMIKTKFASASLVLLDGYYKPPVGSTKPFQETTKLTDLGVVPTLAGTHTFVFELKQEENKDNAVIINSLDENIADRRDKWRAAELKSRQEAHGIKSSSTAPDLSSKIKDLPGKKDEQLMSARSERTEYDAESAEKEAMAKFLEARAEREALLEQQRKKEEEDAMERFIIAEAERQLAEERGEIPKSSVDLTSKIQEFLKSPKTKLAEAELAKREKQQQELDALPRAAQLLKEEKERADARAAETRKELARMRQEREAETARLKEAAEKMNSVFTGAGRHVGIEIWRIENFQAVKWPATDYGKFCTGDSYVLLQTIRITGPWKVFFWLGSESTKDETGTAALKAIELDEVMGGACPHSRETQGHESEAFLDLFSDYGGVQYLEGGIESAFVKVERDVYPTRLLHCKGKKNIRVAPVPLTYESLNSGDVFVLDAGLRIFQWCGTGSSHLERTKATQGTQPLHSKSDLLVVIRLRDSRGARAKYENMIQGEELEEFWELIGGKGPIADGDEEDDEAYEARMRELIKLYQVSDETGELLITHVGSPPLLQKMLDTNDCFILDIGTEIFVWIGKGCTKQESSQSMAHAQKFLEDNNRPNWTNITRMVEGAEIPSFIEQFRTWVGVDTTDHSILAPLSTQHGRIAKRKEQHQIDVDALLKSHPDQEEERKADFGYSYDLPDKFDTDVDATLTIYRIENFKKVFLPKDQYGIFHAGDSYICTFVANVGSNPPLIYYWLGKNSTTDEKGAAALLTRDLCRTPNGKSPIILRVIQSKEPSHFLNLFKGKMVIKFGGVPSGFSNVEEESSTVHQGPALFHVKGTTELDTKAVQVTAITANLNSADAFVLQDEDTKQQFVWYGSGCELIEKATADAIAYFLGSSIPDLKSVAFDEGEELEAFWNLLGGRGKYLNDPDLQGDVANPRLFSCSNASGVFEIEECQYITQDDLDASDIFLLDCSTRVYVWVGPESNEFERKMSFEYSIKYTERAIETEPDRPRVCPIIVVDAGHEPPGFTCWFHGWDVQIAQETADAGGINPESQNSYNQKAPKGVRTVYEALNIYIQKTYPYSELRRDAVDKPLPNGGRGIDTSALETYLDNKEFLQLFGMSREAFDAQPDWKRRKAKGRLQLF